MTNRQLVKEINQESMPNGLYLNADSVGLDKNPRIYRARTKAGVLQFHGNMKGLAAGPVWFNAPGTWQLASGLTGRTVLKVTE